MPVGKSASASTDAPKSAESVPRHIARYLADLWRVVFLNPVRYGTLALGPHSAGIAGVAWAVTVIYAATVGSILLANPLRAVAPLQAQVDATSNLVVPTFLVPAVLCLIGVAFGLLLAGSQRAPWWWRGLYLVVVGAVLTSIAAVGAGLGSGGLLSWITLALLAVTIAYIIYMWSRRTRPAVDAVVLVTLSCLVILVSYRSLVTQALLGTGGEQTVATASLILQQVSTLALPVAFLSGISATALGISFVSWGSEELGRRATVPVTLAMAMAALLVQWMLVVRGIASEPGDLTARLTQVVAALVLVGLCWGAWWWCHRGYRARDISPVRVSEAAVLVAVPLSYAVTAAAFIAALLGSVVLAAQLIAPEAVIRSVQSLVDLVGTTAFTQGLRVAIVLGLVLAAVLLVRRGQRLLGAIAAVYALVLGSVYVTFIPAQWFWTPSAVGDIGLIVATGLVVRWSARRTWSQGRAGFALTLALLSALVRQADFFAVPLGFLIGASATAILIVGLVWGYLTDGGEAHENSPRYPGDRQLLVVLGTFLFGATIVAWAVLGKVVATALVLADAAALAVTTLGSALIILVIFESVPLARATVPGASTPVAGEA